MYQHSLKTNKEVIEFFILESIIAEADYNTQFFWDRIQKSHIQIKAHSCNVAVLTMKICKILGYSDKEIKEIVIAALLHDVGKMSLPEGVLLKPGHLTQEEYLIVQTHTSIGYEVLKYFGFSDAVLDAALHHHEFENGSGYPDKATFMQRETKIIAIADKYDAIHNKRIYKMENTVDESMVLMEQFRNRYTDIDDIYKALYTIVYEF